MSAQLGMKYGIDPIKSMLRDAWSNIVELPASVIVSSIVINVLGLALPLVVLQVYDRVLVNKAVDTLVWLMVGLSGVIILEVIIKILRCYLMSWSATQNAYLTDVTAVGRLLGAKAKDVEKESPSTWMDRLDALEQFNAFKSGQSRVALIDLPFMAVYLAIIFLVAGVLGLVVMAVVGAFAVFIACKSRALRNNLSERKDHDHRRYDFITETLSGIEAVKSMAMEPQMQRRLERLQKTSSLVMFRKNLLSNELSAATSLMTNIILIAVVTVGAVMVIAGGLTVGGLACSTMLTSRLIQPIVRGIGVCMELETSSVAKEQAGKLLELPNLAAPQPGGIGVVKGGISLRNVTFSFEGAERPLISVEALDIEPGETIGIKGQQSVGKSTFLRLICGDQLADLGEITIDGLDVNGPYGDALREHISYTCSYSETYEGTILQNITMFRTGPIVEKAKAAARLVGLEAKINRLPKGYDTQLGGSVTEAVPAGILQLVAIARTLASEPKILLFDEANSALDLRADKILQDGLSKLKGQLTQIIVTNRPSLLSIADRVFELRDGALVTAQIAEPQKVPSGSVA